MKSLPVYLDYAATAPLCGAAADAMKPFFEPGVAGIVAGGGNANSLYTAGRDAFAALEAARRKVARAIGASRPAEVIFTSGATEANNAAIFGLFDAAVKARKLSAGMNSSDLARRPHFITSAIEHDSVLKAAKALEARGATVTYLAPDADGFIQVDSFIAALRPTTVAASIQLANSEIGSIQLIRQLAAEAAQHGIAFHTDATQALGKIFLDVAGLGVDAASVSAHKVGGPKGVGALYLKAKTPFTPLIFGGGQESGARSGTQNVAGAAGFAAAAEAAVCGQEQAEQQMHVLRDQIYSRALDAGAMPYVDVETDSHDYLPNIACFALPGIESQTSVLRFDSLGICVSGGSACASHDLAPSHVLSALGIKTDSAQCELRVSIGPATTQADIDAFFEALPNVMDWQY
jgi:cysteine desulfurase